MIFKICYETQTVSSPPGKLKIINAMRILLDHRTFESLHHFGDRGHRRRHRGADLQIFQGQTRSAAPCPQGALRTFPGPARPGPAGDRRRPGQAQKNHLVLDGTATLITRVAGSSCSRSETQRIISAVSTALVRQYNRTPS